MGGSAAKEEVKAADASPTHIKTLAMLLAGHAQRMQLRALLPCLWSMGLPLELQEMICAEVLGIPDLFRTLVQAREDNEGCPVGTLCHHGDLEGVMCLVEGGDVAPAAVVAGDKLPAAPLLVHACRSLTPDLVAYLLYAGADPFAADDRGCTAAHAAASVGDVASLRLLVARGCDVDRPDAAGLPPLHYAVAAGQEGAEEDEVEATVRLLVGAGADVRAETAGATVLHEAASRALVGVARVLVAAGADVDAVGMQGTALHGAAGSLLPGAPDMVRYLVGVGANVNALGHHGRTPLQACTMGLLESAEVLLAAKADVGHRDRMGRTALHSAVILINQPLVACLAAHGADVNARCSEGETPLHHAAAAGNEPCVAALLAAGADAAALGSCGQTPLHTAASGGREYPARVVRGVRTAYGDVVRRLLEEDGVDVGAVDVDLRTALHMAAPFGSVDVVQALLDARADVAAVDGTHRTALQHATAVGNAPVAKVLDRARRSALG